ncbi:hypothetical protein niasHT_005723 [Heterodera trifolii]|uniref:Uncharacterized protein n=1 Tax=Heterodera trifolii TaxID=157864 RepID=A0ABD2LZW6_9BILA
MYLKENLKIKRKQNAKEKLQNLKQNLIASIEQVEKEKSWPKNGKSKNQQIEHSSKNELANLMVEANLDTTIEYEQLMEACAKFGNEKQKKAKAKNLVDKFLNRINVQEMVEKLGNDETLKSGNDKREKQLSAIEEIKRTVGQIMENLNQFKKTGIPSGKGMKCISQQVFNRMAHHLGIEWHQVQPYSDMSNWRLAMRGFSALNAFLKIGIVSNAKKITDIFTPKRGNKKGQQHNHKREESFKNRQNTYEKWMRETARFFKTAYDRLFLQIDEGPKKGRRRRRKRGGRADGNGKQKVTGNELALSIFGDGEEETSQLLGSEALRSDQTAKSADRKAAERREKAEKAAARAYGKDKANARDGAEAAITIELSDLKAVTRADGKDKANARNGPEAVERADQSGTARAAADGIEQEEEAIAAASLPSTAPRASRDWRMWLRCIGICLLIVMLSLLVIAAVIMLLGLASAAGPGDPCGPGCNCRDDNCCVGGGGGCCACNCLDSIGNELNTCKLIWRDIWS